MKSTPKQIEQRFDREVDRFSNLETGQSATIDAPLVLELISVAAAAVSPKAQSLLDVGCGAGNYTLKLLEKFPNLDVTLIDLSRPMLERAQARVTPVTSGSVNPIQGDIRGLKFADGSFDVIVAAAVLHHLRADAEWEAVFRNFHHWLRPGGSVWISDLVEHTFAGVQQMMWARYGEYLANLKDAAYRDAVFAYVAQEDTPKPVMFQIDMLREVGFERIEILHKNSVFAAFGAVRD